MPRSTTHGTHDDRRPSRRRRRRSAVARLLLLLPTAAGFHQPALLRGSLGSVQERSRPILAGPFAAVAAATMTTRRGVLSTLGMSSVNNDGDDGGTSSTTTTPLPLRFVSPLLPATDGDGSNSPTGGGTAMIVLNSAMPSPPTPLFRHLWEKSDVHVCADGGANRLYDATAGSSNRERYLPEFVRGDLDSLLPHVRDYYASTGRTGIERDDDQDTNDLDKSLQKIAGLGSCDKVVVYGAFGGRFDQEMASFQALYKWAGEFGNRIWLYSDETSALLVPSSSTQPVELVLPSYGDSSIREGPTCGLIPMATRCDSVTTTGLRWNLEDSVMEMGGLVSTSNHVLEPPSGGDKEAPPQPHSVLTIRSSHPLIFTAEIVQDPTNH